MSTCMLYTDGGCHGNPGPGGWAFRIVDSEGELVASDAGSADMTTNNRMELIAVIEGLRWIVANPLQIGNDPVTVITDSQYVRLGITQWILKWERNGWRTSAKKPVKNEDLWKTLRTLQKETNPHWEWVKGHSGNEHNEACDRSVQDQIALLS